MGFPLGGTPKKPPKARNAPGCVHLTGVTLPLSAGAAVVLSRRRRSALPPAFFGSYKQACADADDLLFRAGDTGGVDEACRESRVGKLLPNALYVHNTALTSLDPLLRVYEGCGRAFLGEIDGANVIKLHRFSGKVSYLAYPGFDSVPHPELERSYKLSMRTLDVECYDYSKSENPPILHRKETFLETNHPL